MRLCFQLITLGGSTLISSSEFHMQGEMVTGGAGRERGKNRELVKAREDVLLACLVVRFMKIIPNRNFSSSWSKRHERILYEKRHAGDGG